MFTSKVEDDIVNPYFIYVQDLKGGQSVEITISDETGQVYSTQMDSYTKEIELSFIEKNKEYTIYVNSLYEDNVVAEISNIGEIKGNAKITKRYVCDYICEMEENSNRAINDIWDIATDTSIKSEKVEQILNDLEEKNKENKNEEETVVDHVYGRVSKDIDRDNFEDGSLEITYYLDEEEYSTRTSRRSSRRGYKTRFEDEPNDDFDDANPIFNGESIEAVIEEDDEDYFKIIFPKDGYANFWIGHIPSGEDYELEVFDNDDESDEIDWHYAEGCYPDGRFRTLRAVRVRADREYFVKVQGRGSGDYDDNDEYELRAKVYSSPDIEEDEYEDNNDFADATDDVFDNMRIGSKKSIEANIHSNTRKFEDEDYYELELKEKCGIRIDLDRGTYYIMVEGDRDDDYDDDEQYKIGYYLDEQPQIPIEYAVRLNIKYKNNNNRNESVSLYFLNVEVDKNSKDIKLTDNTIILMKKGQELLVKFLNSCGDIIKREIPEQYINMFMAMVNLKFSRNSRGWDFFDIDFDMEAIIVSIQ